MLKTSIKLALRQPSLNGFCEVSEAVDGLANAVSEARGAIFTRREVVEFILDLAGYTADQPLHQMRLLEPSFGEGNFLFPVIERLLAAWRGANSPDNAVQVLANCIRAVEIHSNTFNKTKIQVIKLLEWNGFSEITAYALADEWLVQGDFLLAPLAGRFEFVVGNPPYVRQESIPASLMAEYRTRYRTLYDRADLYIPFIERSLHSLADAGQLGFICADRWMKNRYGGPLRRMVADSYHLRFYVDMVNTPAFQTEVIAYPAIVIISRVKKCTTRAADRPEIDPEALSLLTRELLSDTSPSLGSCVREIENVVCGNEPWIFDAVDEVALIRRLEADFPTLEEAGCKVGIGVATGADKAFIGDYGKLDVEPDRKLPLVTTRDILSGTVDWQGRGVINPFNDDGSLVELSRFPRLHRYLEARRDEIAGRHVAKKAPDKWYRTIDRITPSIANEPKLLIPDIKGDAHVVYDAGRFYPHHNLYYITSKEWDLRALQAVLLSGIARFFVSIYTTKMHGGFLRFQAQYLRRIRVPYWSSVPKDVQHDLIVAARANDVEGCNAAVFKLYKMSAPERTILKGNKNGA